MFEKATGSKDSSTNIRAQGQGSSHPEPCWNVSSQGPGDGNSGFRQGGSWESKELEGGKQRSAELGSWRLLNLLPQPGTLLRYPCCGPADQACGSHTGWHPEITAGGHTQRWLLECLRIPSSSCVLQSRGLEEEGSRDWGRSEVWN